MLTPYQFASNTPIQAIDLDGLEAFIVHGSTQKSTGLQLTKQTRNEIIRITGNTIYDDGFRWNSYLLNNESSRAVDARSLADYIVNRRIEMMRGGTVSEGEPISLVGYSHGGNVAIQAAAILKSYGIPVNLLTISTPAGEDKLGINELTGDRVFGEDPKSLSNIHTYQ